MKYFPALMLVACTGCGAPAMIGTHIGGDLQPSDSGYPAVNAGAAQAIEIGGTLAPALQLKLTAHYLTDGSSGCKSSPTFIAGAVEGVSFASSISVPVALERRGEHYSAKVMVDQFQPGRCDWRFGYVSAEVSKGPLVSIENIILRARDGWNTPFTNTGRANSYDTPVLLRCSFRRLENIGPNARGNACIMPGDLKHPDKIEHYFKTATAHYAASFIDVDVPPP
jgi:hypothetical protein